MAPLWNNSQFIYSQSRASLPDFNYIFANGMKLVCPELWYSEEKYSTRCSHSAISIGNNKLYF